VLSAGPTPRTQLNEWTFSLIGEVDKLKNWTWEEFQKLPSETITQDIHCVTGWSKLDTVWEGVSVDTLLEGVETSAEYVMAFSDGGYTTNVPHEELTGGRAWIVFKYDGAPLEKEHGGPARLLVPHLYFWKSAKWVRGFQLIDKDEPGFWETYGYHMHGDPWLEQVQRRLTWHLSKVVKATYETPRAKTLALEVPDWPGHTAGQHVDVRLTAPDGYQARVATRLHRHLRTRHKLLLPSNALRTVKSRRTLSTSWRLGLKWLEIQETAEAGASVGTGFAHV
jgi:hypothetical protein